MRIWAEERDGETAQEETSGQSGSEAAAGLSKKRDDSFQSLFAPAVRVWFEDNGIGIAPEDHIRIFQMLERLHPPKAYEGTGIGLAIARKGIRRMGGHIGVQSELGKGSKFWIELKKAG